MSKGRGKGKRATESGKGKGKRADLSKAKDKRAADLGTGKGRRGGKGNTNSKRRSKRKWESADTLPELESEITDGCQVIVCMYACMHAICYLIYDRSLRG